MFEFFEPKIPAAYRRSELVFLGNIDPVLQRRVLEQVERPRVVACDTMNFWIKGKPQELRETLAKVQVLLINDQEARELSGEWNLVRAARAIRAMGPRTLVVKKGEHGVLMFTDEGSFSAPALPLEHVVDPTGAGDTFAGGFVGYLASAPETWRRDAAPGGGDGQHARVLLCRGLQPGPAADAHAARDRGPLQGVRGADAVREPVAFCLRYPPYRCRMA